MTRHPERVWEHAGPATLRRMATRQRAVAASFQRWADEAEHKAATYDDLADVREAEIKARRQGQARA